MNIYIYLYIQSSVNPNVYMYIYVKLSPHGYLHHTVNTQWPYAFVIIVILEVRLSAVVV